MISGKIDYCNVVSLRSRALHPYVRQTDFVSKGATEEGISQADKTKRQSPCSTGWWVSKQFDHNDGRGGVAIGGNERKLQEQSAKELPWNTRELPLVG